MAGLAFIGAGGTLALAHGATVTAPIAGFAIGDIISMAGVDAISFKASTGVLTLSDAGTTVTKLHLAGSFAGDVFGVSQSGGVGVISLTHS
jgi:deoxyribose-phosphate aldolase